MAVRMLQAGIAGDERRLQVLEQQLEEMQENQQKQEEQQQQGRGRQPGTRVTDSMAGGGGGGRSVVIGGPLVSEIKKQPRLLGGIGNNTRRGPTIQVSGNVEAVISR